jgi:hypothetical protein
LPGITGIGLSSNTAGIAERISESDYRDLNQAKRQLEYDRAHHANRRVIARDLERVRAIENDIREDRHAFNRR